MANELMTIPQIQEMATIIKDSALINYQIKGNQGSVFLILLMGQELGLTTTQALNSIYVVNGKPSISTQLMLSLIYKHCPKATIKIEEHKKANGEFSHISCYMKRPDNELEFESIWDFNKASVAGLYPAQKADSAWKKYPTLMCKWRAIAECARTVFPDVIQGFYSGEEMEDAREERRIAENEAQPSDAHKPLTPEEEQKVKENVEEVINNPPDLNPERHGLEIKFCDLWKQMSILSRKNDKGEALNGFKLSFGMKAMDDYKEFDDQKLISYAIELEEAILNLKPSK